MRVQYTGDQPVAVPGIEGWWEHGQEADVDDATGKRLLRNVHFIEVAATPAEPAPEPVPPPPAESGATVHFLTAPEGAVQ